MTRLATPEDKVEWVLDFLNRDLTGYQENDWRALRKEVSAFIAWEKYKQREPSQSTPERLSALQEELRQFLTTYEGFNSYVKTNRSLDGRLTYYFAKFMRKSKLAFISNVHIPAGPLVYVRPMQIRGLVMDIEEGRFSVHIEADLTETVLFEVAQALTRIDLTALALCPQCGAPFIARHGAQKFCSTRCKSRASLKAFRTRQRQAKATRNQAGKRAR